MREINLLDGSIVMESGLVTQLRDTEYLCQICGNQSMCCYRHMRIDMVDFPRASVSPLCRDIAQLSLLTLRNGTLSTRRNRSD
jgi:hypothetical protein